MKSIPILILSALLLGNVATQAQPNQQNPSSKATAPAVPAVPQPGTTDTRTIPGRRAQAEPQPQFDIDFPGGTPQQLIDAIEKQSGIHVNAVIPNEHASYIIPALKMNGVILNDLFLAMKAATVKSVKVLTGAFYTDTTGRLREAYQGGTETAGFQNVGLVWYFKWDRPQGPLDSKLKLCRYYQLGPYLTGRKVEDITTAVQTGWKMLGETNLPELKFHQETAMLIAVGEENQLKLIDNVLEQLRIDSVPRVLTDFTSPKPATNSPGR